MNDKVQAALKAREEEKKKKEQEQDPKRSKVAEALAARDNRMKSDLSTVASDWEKRINAEIEAYNKHISSSAWGADFLNSSRQNSISTTKLIDEISAYRKYLGDEKTDEILSGLNSIKNSYNLRSSFGSEDEYNSYVEERKAIDAILNSEDFEEYYNLGLNVENPSYEDATGTRSFWSPLLDKMNISSPLIDSIKGKEATPVTNMVTFAEKYYNDAMIDSASGMVDGSGASNPHATLVANIHQWMTEDEKKVYNYYVGKGDAQKAEEYLNGLKDKFEQRAAGDLVTKWDDTASELIFSLVSGANQAFTGLGNLDNLINGTEGDSTTNRLNYAYGQMSSNNEGAWKVANDLAQTTGNMLPSIAVSSATGVPLFGAVLMGVSSAGNSYSEMRSLGYSANQARAYGVMVGASEAALQYAIGGISKLGGKAVDKVAGDLIAKYGTKFTTALAGINNGIARVAINYGGKMLGKMGSEAFEESLQSVLEPMFKTIVTGENLDIDWGEVAYSALLGALSAGLLEGAPTIAGEVGTYKQGAEIKNQGTDSVNRLKTLGSTYSADSVAYRLAGKVNDKTGAYTIGRLLNEVGAGLSEQNMTDITSALEAKGVTSKDAKTIAKWLNKAVDGGYFNKSQIKALEENEVISQVMKEVIIDQNSTVNQRIQGYNEALYSLAKKTTSPSKGTDTSTKESPLNVFSNDEVARKIAEATGEDFSEVAKTIAKGAEARVVSKTTPAEANALTDENSAPTSGKTTVNGKEASIKGIASIKDGAVMLEIEGGEKVNLSDVEFGSSEEGLIYESVADMGLDAATATAFVKGYDPNEGLSAEDYILGFKEAYRYGEYGFPVQEMSKKGFSASLSEASKSLAYSLGKTNAKYKTEAMQKAVSKASPENKVKLKKTVDEGTKTIEEALVDKGLTSRQRESLKGLKEVSKALGVEFRIFESSVGEDGKRIGENGRYDPNTGIMYIDLYAGLKGEGTILFTAAHELTHFIRQWSPEKFKVFADFLLDEYGKKGVSVNALVQAQIKKAANKGRDIDFDTAYEEVVADACESFLADGNAMTKIAELKAKDKSLWQKIKSYLTKLVEKIKKAYEGLSPDSVEGRIVSEMLDSAEKLRDMWTEALVDAGENYNSSEFIEIDTDTESVSPNMFSERTWTASDYVIHRDQMAEKISKAIGVSVEKAKSYIDDINSIAKMIADDRARLDYEASSFGSAFVSNVEYGGSFDYTTLCKKRRIYTGTFTEIQKRLNDVALSPDDILTIRNLMIEEGIEATCGLCYVEGSRANMGKFAKEFIRLYKRDNPNAWIPNMADVNTPDGVEQMRITHPDAYEQYVYFWNHYGKLNDSDPALFASQQKPKLYEARKEYKGEILEHFKGDLSVTKKNLNGGIRMQSFSDFEIVHLIDTMQVIMDMSTVGLAGQAYTKVPEFAKAFGNTGLKINLSLIAKDVDADGNLIFDDREGMPHETAFDLRNKYSKNVGTIIVVFTDAQLLAAMADARIDYIIPFHRSQWKKGQYGAMGLPKGTKDYTFMQNEKLIKQTYHEYRGKMVKDKASNYMPNEYWDFSKSGKENAEAYLKMCAENNKRPKFYKLLDYDGNGTYSLKKDGSTDGYWKLLIDFKMYDNDGVGSPQMAVTPTFNMDEAKTMLDESKGGHSKYPVASSVVDKFVDEYNKKNGMKYSDRDSEGNELSKEQQEFFKDSKIRDKNGNLMKVYHGSPNEFFTFKQGYAMGWGTGMYFTDNRIEAADFGDNIIEAYLNIKNPYNADTMDYGAIGGEKTKTYRDFDMKVWKERYSEYDTYEEYVEDISGGVGMYEIYEEEKEVFNRILRELGYDGIIAYGSNNIDGYEIVAFNESQPKLTTNKNPTTNPDIRYSDRDSYAPVFYSQMAKEIDAMKMDKVGSASILNHLKNRGIKNEEIKWSGIEAFLEGKKSVTKAELQEFLAGSQLQIEENNSGISNDAYTELDNLWQEHFYSSLEDVFDPEDFDETTVSAQLAFLDENGMEMPSEDIQQRMIVLAHKIGKPTRWEQYKLNGGSNYRELVFKMPNSSYTNQAMRMHWGDEGEGILAHARIQDMTTADGKKMLFIEEIQSDWHNEGARDGYQDAETESTIKRLREEADIAFYELEDYSTELTGMAGEYKAVAKTQKGRELLRNHFKTRDALKDAENAYVKKVPDAPFRDTYHEYVLKRLLRMAAEDGYDSIGWTPAEIQTERWSKEYAEGYRIEYDQEIPKFLRKYGKKWGATVGKTELPSLKAKTTVYDVNRQEAYDSISEWEKIVQKELKAQGLSKDKLANLTFIEHRGFMVAFDAESGTEYDRAEIRKTGNQVWSMDITEPMKESVLYEGQVLYSDRDFPSNAEVIAKDYFGTTTKWSETGWLLKDGTQLDFSGRHWERYPELEIELGESYYRGKRNVEHFEIVDAFPELRDLSSMENRGKNLNGFLQRGNIRIVGDYAIDLLTMPTDEQFEKLRSYFRENIDKYIVVGIGTNTLNFKEGTNASIIIEAIRDYFLKGKDRRSELMRFHNEYFSDRDTESVSNRTLLANALESVAKEGEERNLLRNYKTNLRLIESEQAKLAEVKKKANEIRFTKGRTADETKEMRDLDFEAKQIATRINSYDRELLKLEAMQPIKNVLAREKQLAYKKAEQRGKEAVAKQKERDMATIRTLMDRYQESRKKGVESRSKTALKRKLRKVIGDLNKIFSHGTKERNVKKGAQDAVASALALGEILFSDEISNADIVTLGVDSVTEKESKWLNEYRDALDMMDALLAENEVNKAKYSGEELVKRMNEIADKIGKLQNKINRLNTQLSDVFKRERARLNRSTVASLIDQLAKDYKSLASAEEEYLKNAFEEKALAKIEQLSADLEGTLVKDMSLDQLEEVYKVFKMVKHMVTEANKLFRDGKTEDLMQRVSGVQRQLLWSLKLGKKDPMAKPENAKNLLKDFWWNEMKPLTAFEALGSDAFKELFWDAVKADGEFAKLITEAGSYLQEQREKHHYADWDINTVKEFTLSDGKVFKLTLGDIMSIYAYTKRDQAYDHMTNGGFTFDENNHYKGKLFNFKNKNSITEILEKLRVERKHAKLTETYLVDDAILNDIVKLMYSKEYADIKAYTDAMQEYFKVMAQKGNEISNTLYGIDLFGEEFYIPLQSSSDYMNSTKEALNNAETQVSLKNMGMTKATKPHASNPIVLRQFDELWLDHIDKMSKYCAYVLPIENLQRVFNNVASVNGQSPISTKALIASIFGNEARDYIDQYITDLNGGAKGASGYKNPLMSMFAKFKKTAVGAKLSVVIQQPFAILRAMSEIRPDYFVPFLHGISKTQGIKAYEELKKYAPVAILKEMGGFDIGSSGSVKSYIGTTEYHGLKGKAKGLIKDADYRSKAIDDSFMFGATKMDELGWSIIWLAVKKEVAAQNKYTKGSEEFLNACGERFQEVVLRTQVYDSVNSRSGMMRSKSDATKFATSFAGEPTTIVNMYISDIINLARAIKFDEPLGKPIAKVARDFGVITASIIITTLAKTAIYANYDDDEDESWTERWMRNFGDSLTSDLNPLTWIPFIRDLVSVWEGWTIERPDMALLADLTESVRSIFDDIQEGAVTMDTVYDLIGDMANALGIPAKNIVKDTKGIVNVIKGWFDPIKTIDTGDAFKRGWLGESQSKSDALYEAIINGAKSEIEYHKKSYKTDNAYKLALRQGLRDNDSRIQEAAIAHMEGDISKRVSIIREIMAEGYFTQDVIQGAVNNEVQTFTTNITNAIKAKNNGDEAEYKKIVKALREKYPKDFIKEKLGEPLPDEEEKETEDKEISFYSMEDYYNTILDGDAYTLSVIKEDILKTDVANGKDRDEAESSFNTKFASYLKDEYTDGNLNSRSAINMLVEYGGKSEDEAKAKVQYWDFKLTNPDSDLTESAVTTYYEKIESSGISINVYEEYTKKRAKCKGTDSDGDGKTDSGSKQAEVLKVIDSLPITRAQKDALYLAEGYAKSNLYKTPWH